MLGNTLFLYLSQKYKTIAFDRNDFDVLSEDWASLKDLLITHEFERDDFVINCIGMIPQKGSTFDGNADIVNSCFPHELHYVVSQLHGYHIHISTNCVFPHSFQPYSEEDLPAADDEYGRTKYDGEPSDATILRTSIIGEEKSTAYSLLSWALASQNPIKGYQDHLWNGVTCLQLGKIIDHMIQTKTTWRGVRHFHSNEIVSKYDLLKMIFDIYKHKNTILPFTTGKSSTKLLRSVFKPIVEIPSLYQQITEQRLFFKRQAIQLGSFTTLETCRFCNAATKPWFQFEGMYPLAGGFLREGHVEDDSKIPLSVSLCETCELLQCNEVISSDTLFKKGYFYFSSMIPFLVTHFKAFTEMIKNKYAEPGKKKLVLEIGCNDGVLLRNLEGEHFQTIGVDPSHTVEKLIQDGFTIYNDYFTRDLAESIRNKHGQVDIFLSSNSFAHIHDMKNIMEGLKTILKPGGLAIIEVHNSLKILQELNFEFMYHEHMTYYTKMSFCTIFERVGMWVEKIEDIDVHGGSMRVFIRNSEGVSPCKKDLFEDSLQFHKSLHEFPLKLAAWKKEFLDLYYQIKKEGKTIVGYGASGRANMFLRYLDIELDGIVDDAESKVGAYMPLLHTKIEYSSSIYNKHPDYILLISWAYKDTILQKHKSYLLQGGTFLIPLPTISKISLSKDLEQASV